MASGLKKGLEKQRERIAARSQIKSTSLLAKQTIKRLNQSRQTFSETDKNNLKKIEESLKSGHITSIEQIPSQYRQYIELPDNYFDDLRAYLSSPERMGLPLAYLLRASLRS